MIKLPEVEIDDKVMEFIGGEPIDIRDALQRAILRIIKNEERIKELENRQSPTIFVDDNWYADKVDKLVQHAIEEQLDKQYWDSKPDSEIEAFEEERDLR